VAISRPRSLAAIVVLVALALALGSSAVLAPEADATVSRSTLTLVTGSVVVSHDGSEFRPAHEGDVIAAGDAIRTDPDATAEITYFEGSSVRLESDTQIVVESLRTQADGGTVIQMLQTLGRTWHVVTRLISGSSRYEVRTPSSTASVRGTIFAVDVHVDANGPTATVTTSEGVVVHSALAARSTGAVRVTAGQESTKSASRPVEPVQAAAPATLREAPARPASAPAPAKRHAPSSDRVEVRTVTRVANPGRAITQPKDRAKASKQKTPGER
jgi:hypothetical protein